MEFRDIVHMYWTQRRLFLLIVVTAMFVSLLWQVNQPVRYRADLLLNIGRQGIQATNEYTYDSFYRLQADERFADTVVRWLQSPRVVSDILKESGMSASAYSDRVLMDMIGAKRLSSQVIELSFSFSEKGVLEKESGAIVKVLNEYTARLNSNGQADGWFVVVGSSPVISDARVSLRTALLVGCGTGLFLAFWSVALRHAWMSPASGKDDATHELMKERV